MRPPGQDSIAVMGCGFSPYPDFENGLIMSDGKPNLAALREELDSIDNALHDLLMRRAAIAAGVRASKGDAPVWRPAREAQILRRLMTRHTGPFPRATIIQLWREIVSAMVRLQGEFAVAVYAQDGERLCRDMARDHFGGETPLSLHSSARAVLNAVQEGTATVGVLPIPEDSEEAPWWPTLAGIARGGNVSVCARLPFAPIAPGNGDSALCVASISPDESGDDRSFFVLRTSSEVSRARLNDAIAAAGVKPVRLIGSGVPMDGTSVFMAELEGFAGPDDSRIARLTDPDNGIAESAIFLGVYATPLSSDDIADRGEV
ncbi:MAG: chorismate mutase [Rhodospirillaceae bacterium TMED63]|nr:MAG: chorismate mutase [Rhodospirillaceae bacterium TMED63]